MLLALVLGSVFGFVGSMPVAGPIALLVFAYGAHGRARSAFYVALGAALAESIYAFVTFWGFAELLRRYPLVVPVSRAVGAVVLLATGAYMIARKPRDDRGPGSERSHSKRGGKFLLGFTITALNPTLLVTWTAAVTALSSALGHGLRTRDALPFAAGACAGIVGWFAVLLVLMRRYREKFSPSTLDRVARGAGVLLIGLGLWFAVSFAVGLARQGPVLPVARGEGRAERRPFTLARRAPGRGARSAAGPGRAGRPAACAARRGRGGGGRRRALGELVAEGREVVEQAAEARAPEARGERALELGDRGEAAAQGRAPRRGDAHELGPAVTRVGRAAHDAHDLELLHEAADRLLADADALGEVGQPQAASDEVLQERGVREA